MPRIGVTEEERKEMFRIFYGNISLEIITCVYCGKPATHLDHLYPLIKDQKPTGYYSEIGNFVPCCSECNQKKGNKYWHQFMKDKIIGESDEEKKRELERLVIKIENYQKKFPAKKIDISDKILGLLDELSNNIKNLYQTRREV